MDLRNSALVACVSWAIGATIAAVGLMVFVTYREPQPMAEVVTPPQRATSVIPATVQNQLAQQAKVARELSSQVNSLESSLRQYRGNLQSARKEVEKLKRESEQSIDLAIDLLQQSRPESVGEVEETFEPPMDPTPQPPEQAPENEEMTMLREQVASREAEIEQLREEHEESLTRLLMRDLALRDETNRIFLRLGPDAAEEIAESLRHPEADVRIWAANVLARMGAAANATVGDLTIAARDEDPRVRVAVEAALKAVAD